MSNPVDLDTQQSVILPIDGPVAPDRYIVKLKESVSTRDHITSHFPDLVESADSPIKDVFEDNAFHGEIREGIIVFIAS